MDKKRIEEFFLLYFRSCLTELRSMSMVCLNLFYNEEWICCEVKEILRFNEISSGRWLSD